MYHSVEWSMCAQSSGLQIWNGRVMLSKLVYWFCVQTESEQSGEIFL